jgi:hypothetical protein
VPPLPLKKESASDCYQALRPAETTRALDNRVTSTFRIRFFAAVLPA